MGNRCSLLVWMGVVLGHRYDRMYYPLIGRNSVVGTFPVRVFLMLYLVGRCRLSRYS